MSACCSIAVMLVRSGYSHLAQGMKRQKLAKLSEIRSRIPYVSQSALSGLLNIREELFDLPDSVSRGDIRESRDDVVKKMTPYGTIHTTIEVPCVGGGEMNIEIQDPFAMFAYLAETSASFASLIRQTWMKAPSTPEKPCKMIFYSDEVAPGNQLAHKNARKLEAFYWSILEFGMEYLCDEMAWLELTLIRSGTVRDKIKDGMSTVFATLLNYMFNRNDTHNFATGGINVKLHDSDDRLNIFIVFGLTVADEAALHAECGCKGSSGLKPCFLCLNVFDAKSERDIIANDSNHIAVDHTCTTSSDLILQSTATMNAIVDKLEEGHATMGKDAFSELQTRLGWNYLQFGMMCTSLRGIVDMPSQGMYDWMHVIFVGGVFNTHMRNIMSHLRRWHTFAHLHEYARQWVWPKHIGNLTGVDCLIPSRASSCFKADGKFKSQASEGRSILVIMGMWAYEVLLQDARPSVRQHAACLVLLVLVVEMIEASARGGISPNDLRDASEAYLKTFKALYGPEQMHIKFHELLHMWMHLLKFGVSPIVSRWSGNIRHQKGLPLKSRIPAPASMHLCFGR